MNKSVKVVRRLLPSSSSLPARRLFCNAEFLKYPDSKEDDLLSERTIDFKDRDSSKRFQKVDMGLDADADFFLQQKRKLEAAHRIEKDLETTKISPELENILNTSTNVKPRDIETLSKEPDADDKLDDEYFANASSRGKERMASPEQRRQEVEKLLKTDDSTDTTTDSKVASSSNLMNEKATDVPWWNRRQKKITPDDDRVVALSEELLALAKEVTPNDEQLKERDIFLDKLQQVVAGQVEGAMVTPFGSVVNGFWTPSSDIDICLQVPGVSTRNSQIKVLRKVANELHKLSSHFIEPRFGAKIPIIHWAPRRPGMLACDISVNNIMAIVNSRLIGKYTEIDPRMQILGMAIKYWAKARGINDRSRGTLSSFALISCLVHFLQRRPVPILPSLQDLAFTKNHPPVYINGYATDSEEIQEELQYQRGDKPPNDENVGYLLHEFFQYFAYNYKFGVISIRDCVSFTRKMDDESCYFFVDNPFEVGKDVANVVVSQYSRIRQEFRRAQALLSQGVGFMDMCSNNHKAPNSGATVATEASRSMLGNTLPSNEQFFK